MNTMTKICVLFLFIYISTNDIVSSEAHCSKYHYEEQILSKQIRMELRLENLEKKLENIARYKEPERTSCEDGWIAFQSACYLFPTIEVDFNEAEKYCLMSKGHLVSIRNSKENEFIKSHVAELKAEKFWIGLTDEVTEGIWMWIDTYEQSEFYNWGGSQPNGGKTANCAAIWQGFLNMFVDEPCTNRQFIPICKKIA